MLILLVIWTPRPTQRFVFWIGFAWILATTLVCRPDANGLGLRLSSLQSSLWITAGGLFFGGVIVGIALELRTLHPLHGAGSLELHMAGYLLWAFEQQFILQDLLPPQHCFRQRTFRTLFSWWQLSFGESSRVLSSWAIATFTHSDLSMGSWVSAWRFQCRMRLLTT